MRRSLASVMSVMLSPSGQPAVRLLLRDPGAPSAGQVLLACRPGGDDPLRQVLLPIAFHEDGLSALQPGGIEWLPGEQLDLLGPIGNGFRPSPSSRRWLLAALGVSPDVLLPLMDLGLDRGASLAAWCDSTLPPLPPQVEIPSDLEHALEWADYLGLALTPEWLETRATSTPILETGRRRLAAEAMVILPMPCGTGVCSACAVGGGHAARRACIDGPVMALGDLTR